MDQYLKTAMVAAMASAFAFPSVHADTVPLGPSFQVSTAHLSSDQENDLNPSVAGNAAGGFLVVWLHETQPLNGGPYTDTVYMRLYAADGTPLNAPVAVGGAAFRSVPSAAMAAGGDSVIVWNGVAGGPELRRFDAAGNPIGAAVSVGQCHLPSSYYDPVVAMAPDGDFVMGLTSHTQTLIYGNSVVAAYLETSSDKALRFAADGTPRGSCIDVANLLAVNQRLGPPSLALDAAGDFVIAWNASPDPLTATPAPVYAQRYGAGGLPKGLPAIVALSGILSTGGTASDAVGDFRIAWSLKNDSVNARFYSADGLWQNLGQLSPTTVYTAPSGGSPPGGTGTHVTSNAANQTAITWLGFTTVAHTYVPHLAMQRFAADGSAIGTPLQLDDAINTTPYGVGGLASAIIDGHGGVVATWEDEYSNIRARRFSSP